MFLLLNATEINLNGSIKQFPAKIAPFAYQGFKKATQCRLLKPLVFLIKKARSIQSIDSIIDDNRIQ